jgi:hypothetical protein
MKLDTDITPQWAFMTLANRPVSEALSAIAMRKRIDASRFIRSLNDRQDWKDDVLYLDSRRLSFSSYFNLSEIDTWIEAIKQVYGPPVKYQSKMVFVIRPLTNGDAFEIPRG